MKNTIILIAMILSFNLSAQIKEYVGSEEISNVKQATVFIAGLNKSSDGSYFVNYLNLKYRHITDIKTFVIGDRETVIQFKNTMLDMLKNDTKEKNIELEGKVFEFKKKGKNIYTTIFENGNSSVMRYVNEKFINKIFPENL
ncbi:hypothetical protein ES676_07490 [Bizionia saleffrena]|uniref:DUF4252 domain-containing protein n=1 Tax=Bizionia saleffrena TaxID=291189 RepID=A0A8H2QFC8_9FLAO|nr:hypothetical protein [Bizionia saleffrena]TYB74505.1 hypothetical protein ES676_07490 [Bizionia saleffrena]